MNRPFSRRPRRLQTAVLGALLPLVFGSFACQSDTATGDGATGAANASPGSPHAARGAASPANSSPAAPATAAAKAGAGAANAFGLALFSHAAKTDAGKNVFLSPTSLSLALSMTASGTTGETRRAMAGTLGMPEDAAKADAVSADLQKALASSDPKVTLNIASALWYDRSIALSPDFTARCKASYQADATPLTFTDPTAAQSINTWAAAATDNKITNLVAASDLAPPMVLYLTNAVYFKGLWTNPFPREATKRAPFHPESGAAFAVPMMRSKSQHAGYLKTAGFEAVRLPYGSGAYQFYAFLPAKGKRLGDFVNELNGDAWRDWTEKFGEQSEVTVSLPRFRARFEGEMKGPLTALGMGAAFRDSDDFAPMGLKQPGSISKVKHVAVLEVNEEGTEAAAATAVGVQVVSMPMPLRVTFDRPFFCAIVHKETGAILFAGAIHRPQPL
jgi:serine protease inhibitor